LRAECDFSRAGKVIIEEHFSNENVANRLTYDSDVATPNPQNPVDAAAEAAIAA
jgi:hypothetical protein